MMVFNTSIFCTAIVTKEIFTLPVPSTALVKSPEYHQGLRRSDVISCEYEDAVRQEVVKLSLIFKDTWAVKITYYTANEAPIIPIAYDKVVDFGDTTWLKMIKSTIATNRGSFETLRHFGIFFDDGPFYEFICESFQTRMETSQE